MRALNQLIGSNKPSNIDEIIRESIKLDAPFQHFATVMIQEPDGIIKGISQSKKNNLILDNFGTLLAEMFTTPSKSQDEITLTDILNAAKTIQFYGDNTASDMPFNYNVGYDCGTTIQVGAGATAAARDDYAIETPFIVAPEDDLFVTGSGSYAAGAIAVAGAIIAGGNGTIAECILALKLLVTAGNANPDIALFHDILASTEAFAIGETITATYTINL